MADIRTRRVDANGLSFVVDEVGEGPDIALCLHGFPESRYSWRYQLPWLAARGWHAVAPDLRGYGDSSRPVGREAYRIERLVDDVVGLFDALGARKRLLIAHDWGALIAWVFAIEQCRSLDGLVIMNVPHPAVFQTVLRSSFAQWMKSWYVLFFQMPKLPELGLTAGGAAAVGKAFYDMAIDKSRFPDAVLDVYRQNALKPGAMTAMVNYYRANVTALSAYGAGRARMIETPTLMIWGEEDAALGLELTQGYRPYVKDFTLRRLPAVSHWVQQEAPEEVNAQMGHWLDQKGIMINHP